MQNKSRTFQAVKAAFSDCFSTSTGHGLPQIAKQGNLFLRVIWAVFFVAALVGNSVFIYQAVDQYLLFGVVTTTKINRDSEMILPSIAICSNHDPQDMILYCYHGPEFKDCNWNKLKLHVRFGYQFNCLQLNYGTNKTGLIKAEGEGLENGYRLSLYYPPDSEIYFAASNNSARVVETEVREYVYPGQLTDIVLSKSIQTVLGPPYSQCNETQDYRQVTCTDDCFNTAMSEMCGCAYPAECGLYDDWNKECVDAWSNSSAFKSHCNLQCPEECDQVRFPFNRIDVDFDISQRELDDPFKSIISAKFNISGMSDEQLKKRLTMLRLYFAKLETTEISQSPIMTSANLVGNVGGLLGK